MVKVNFHRLYPQFRAFTFKRTNNICVNNKISPKIGAFMLFLNNDPPSDGRWLHNIWDTAINQHWISIQMFLALMDTTGLF